MELQPDYGQQDSQQRTVLVLLLLMALFFLWSTTFMPRSAQEEETTQTEEQPADKSDSAAKGPDAAPPAPKATPGAVGPAPTPPSTPPPSVPPTAPPPKPEPPKQEPTLKRVVRRSRLFTAVFTNQDAALESLTLLDYFRDPPSQDAAHRARKTNPDADVAKYGLPLLGQEGAEPSLVLGDRTAGGETTVTTLFVPRRYEVVSPDGSSEVVFRTSFGDGLEVTKTFRVPGDEDALQRHVLLEVQVRNGGPTAVECPGYRLRGAGGIAVDVGPAAWKRGRTVPDEREQKAAADTMAAAVALGSEGGELNVARAKCSALQKEPLARSDAAVEWAAVQSSYFTVILDPLPAEGEKWVWSGGASPVGEHNLGSTIETQNAVLAPGQSVVHRYRLYAGPKQRGELAAYEAGYEKVIEFSRLYVLKVALGWILHGSHALLPNYGVAIIILTIFVRILLHPLSHKSQVSMAKMQKLQPQMKEVRDKYKNDKPRQQQELMKLYREYGVSPFGGCLPILLQLPIFIGLWGMLRESIELRHAPFALWIEDLSQPDCLIPGFPGFWILQDLNLLPILCCVIMFIQQQMTPKSPDPQQQQTQKLMGYTMPALLGVLFYGVASGLSLYFSASMLLGFLEQKRIKSHLDKLGDLKPVQRKPDKQAKKAFGPGLPRKRKPF
jgi:YidC/Oxa1 family membrane protein insertase